MSTGPDGTGSPAFDALAGALELAHAWAGSPLAVILSGSHAAGDAVWVEHEGRMLSLSDLDLYLVLEDDASCRAAARRARAARAGLRHRSLALGLAAPLEAAFLTTRALARLPARPGTIELRRHGRVVSGAPGLLDRVPAWQPREVSMEEVALLLENRGCELLWCRPLVASPDPLARLQGRHALLKCTLDLAGVEALLGGAYPDGAAARVRWAREHVPAGPGALAAREDGAARERDRLWDDALAWRAGHAVALDPAAAREEWDAAARCWSRTWWEVSARLHPGAPDAPAARAIACARRARLRRRLRRGFGAGTAEGPSRLARLAHALDGTLQHRVHASAALLLLSAAGRLDPPPAPGVTRALARLGVVSRDAAGDQERARREVVLAWDRWLLDGQRTAEGA